LDLHQNKLYLIKKIIKKMDSERMIRFLFFVDFEAFSFSFCKIIEELFIYQIYNIHKKKKIQRKKKKKKKKKLLMILIN
jgi:hypothetical protein